MKRLLTVILLLSVAMSAKAGCEKINSCNYSSMWGGFTEFKLTYADSKQEKGSEFDYLISGNESLMKYETNAGAAQIYSIPGVATLWRGIGITGIKTSRACYEDVRDTFAIIQSYAVRALFYLGFSVKGGPELISDTLNVAITNKEDTRIQINPADHMIITGPWTLKGEVKRRENISFELLHEFMANGAPVSLFLKGVWQNNPVRIPIENDQPLNNWLVCLSGKYSREDGAEKFTPVIEDTSNLQTIGDLRALITASVRTR